MCAAQSPTLVHISRALKRRVDTLSFGGKVHSIYNPLGYAREPHERYLTKCGGRRGVALLLGMNPGPWGMAQTGVPFGEVSHVRDWLGITGRVRKPHNEHPKRPITGFACSRSEVSGARLWGWAKARYTEPDAFFDKFFVWNYCPLSFLLASGANHTPDKLSPEERARLYAVCDDGLARVLDAIEPSMIIGVGKFAQKRAQVAAGDRAIRIGTILHPSPASPLANKGWAAQAEGQLRALGAL